jgi:hypothetical protein
MRCGFCGREIPDTIPEDRKGCGQCSGGCRKVHCPYCGYANPLVPHYLKRWVKKDSHQGED